MAAAEYARGALPLSRVVARGLALAALVVGLMVVFLCALAEFPFPWAAAAAAPSILRVAPPSVSFLAVNVIVIALATLSRWDAASSSPSAADPSGSPGSSNGHGALEHPFLELLGPPPTLAPIAEADPSVEEAPPEVVFEDKEAVHVKTVRAQPPRRTMSEKTGGGGGAAGGRTASAAAPELRRAKSENGRRRQRRPAAAAAPVEMGVDDGEAFRQVVEAFIAKQQTWFHREESLIARAAAAGRGEDAGPAVAVK